MENSTFKLCFNQFAKVFLHYEGPPKKVLFIKVFGANGGCGFQKCCDYCRQFYFLTTYYKISLSLQLSQYCGLECFLNIKLFSKFKVTF